MKIVTRDNAIDVCMSSCTMSPVESECIRIISSCSSQHLEISGSNSLIPTIFNDK